ncbi:hypothetical protein ACT7DI_21105 [Bacillus paranthracis]
MKRKALKLALPVMLLIGGVGCGSNAIDEEHAIVSKEDAKKGRHLCRKSTPVK